MSASEVATHTPEQKQEDDVPVIGKLTASKSFTLLSASYHPPDPKKEALIQNASVRILEVEQLLEKIDHQVDKHQRKSSQKLQDFEQIHHELEEITSTLTTSTTQSNPSSEIDPYIVISSSDTKSNDDDDDDDKDDNKDDEKQTVAEQRVHNDKLPKLEPFQSLVSKLQHQLHPNDAPALTNASASEHSQSSESIKMKQSELHTLQHYVKEHAVKMKEKASQYEEKKKQLQNARDRLNKAKARFKKRLNKTKQRGRSRAQTATMTDHKHMHNTKYRHKVSAVSAVSVHPAHLSNSATSENSNGPRLSAANLLKLNGQQLQQHPVTISAVSDQTLLPSSNSNHNHNHVHAAAQGSAPAVYVSSYVSSPSSSPGSYAFQPHVKTSTQSSVASAFSMISDQSFVDDFNTIHAELSQIDGIVRHNVKLGGSSTSLLSDVGMAYVPTTAETSTTVAEQRKRKTTTKQDSHQTSFSESESKETARTQQSYCSSADMSEGNSLQSHLLQLQDIENQLIGDL